MDHLAALLALLALASHAVAALAVLRFLRPRGRTARGAPFVSVLKPLRGTDDRLEENLESFFGLDYPSYEVILCAADPSDPALEVARAVRARHPEVPSRVLVGELPVGLNPKVRILALMTREASADLLLVSDSNVRARPSLLRETLADLDGAGASLASNLVIGIGERSIGATLENLQLNGLIAPAVCLARAVFDITCVTGKSMLLRREALDRVGGWSAVANVLAEDFLLGSLLVRRGEKVIVASHLAETINERWGLDRFIERHDRWLKMRWRISRAPVVFELATNLTLWCVVWVAAAQSAWSVVGALALCVLKMVMEWGVARRLRRGRPMRARAMLLAPVRDLVLAVLWGHAALSDTISWRGGPTLRLGHQSRLVVPEPPPLVAEPRPVARVL